MNFMCKFKEWQEHPPKNLIYTPVKVLIFTRNILAKIFLTVRNAFKTAFFQTE